MVTFLEKLQGKKIDLPDRDKKLQERALQLPPPEIDFTELWREPQDDEGTGFLKILGIVQTIFLFLILILGFFHL